MTENCKPDSLNRGKTAKIYYVQVEGTPTEADLQQFRSGLQLKDGKTLPAECRNCCSPEWLWARVPPIRERKTVSDSWLKITLYEGRNRQARRMTAHIGYPTLRLIRYGMANQTLDHLSPGTWREILDV